MCVYHCSILHMCLKKSVFKYFIVLFLDSNFCHFFFFFSLKFTQLGDFNLFANKTYLFYNAGCFFFSPDYVAVSH